jgi:hypothetical protein
LKACWSFMRLFTWKPVLLAVSLMKGTALAA